MFKQMDKQIIAIYAKIFCWLKRILSLLIITCANCMYAKAQMSHTVPPKPSLFAYAIVGMLDEGTG